jgi:hypothetical protein
MLRELEGLGANVWVAWETVWRAAGQASILLQLLEHLQLLEQA